MALGQVMLTQRLQNGRRMAQDAQLVCDGGLALADAAGSLLLAQMLLLHELLQALGLLDVIQIAPLQIFHQRQHPGRGFANSAKCTYRCFLIIKYPRILIHVKL